VLMHVVYGAIRRIEFDIERDRPAVLVIVPETPGENPQILAVPSEDVEGVARALAAASRRLTS